MLCSSPPVFSASSLRASIADANRGERKSWQSAGSVNSIKTNTTSAPTYLASMEFLCNEDKISNAPLPENKLIDLIETCYVTSMNETHSDQNKLLIDRFLKCILEQLNKHSSLYKYIVSMTNLKSLKDDEDAELEDGNFTMTNSVGASWNSKKDGLFNYTVRSAERPRQQFLVTILWIYK